VTLCDAGWHATCFIWAYERIETHCPGAVAAGCTTGQPVLRAAGQPSPPQPGARPRDRPRHTTPLAQNMTTHPVLHNTTSTKHVDNDCISPKLLHNMSKSPVPDNVKDFLRKIGSIGGKKSAQHPDRPRLNREAALARWRKHFPIPKPLEK
jgi:hypothetical protein